MKRQEISCDKEHQSGCLRPPRCVSTGLVVVRLAEIANEVHLPGNEVVNWRWLQGVVVLDVRARFRSYVLVCCEWSHSLTHSLSLNRTHLLTHSLVSRSSPGRPIGSPHSLLEFLLFSAPLAICMNLISMHDGPSQHLAPAVNAVLYVWCVERFDVFSHCMFSSA